jgi:hypothetical protein
MERMWRILFPQRLFSLHFFFLSFWDPAVYSFLLLHVSSRLPADSIIVSGLEASRAPYSKSHARRLKRKEREGLAGGGMESLKTALPSITTMIASGTGSKSAGEDDTPAISTAASAGTSAKLDPKSESAALVEAPPTRLGQIGQGKGTPLSRSQRRRALWVNFFFPLQEAIGGFFVVVVFSILVAQESRAFSSTIDPLGSRVRCKSIRNYSHACSEYPCSAPGEHIGEETLLCRHEPVCTSHLPLQFHLLPTGL